MPTTVCFISFHELALKGRNRGVFERRLQENINALLDDLRDTLQVEISPVKRIAGSLTVAMHSTDSVVQDKIVRAIAQVPGVAAVAIAYKVSRDWDTICQTALRALIEAAPNTDATCSDYTFKVDARRSSTDFPVSSMDINRDVGAYLVQHTGVGVRMKNPDVTVRIKIVEGFSYISTAKVKGIGGLPTGSSGRTVSLLSSGIDSPVATYRVIKRGSVLLGLHFSGRPQTNDSSERLVLEIGEVLARTGGLARIYVVPFGDIQREIAATVEPSLRVIMYRRLMLVIAQQLAHSQKAKALVTGESLGQVASQTLDNLVATDTAVAMPILRPLIGSDKDEIVREARHIDTFDLSIQDAEDCCTLFMPRSPETHARPHQVAASWDLLDIEELTQRALNSVEIHNFTDRFGTHKAIHTGKDRANGC